MKSPLLVALTTSLIFTGIARAGEAVQIDASDVFNMRPINVLVKGAFVGQNNNIDGAGGISTTAAAKFAGVEDPHAMPDDGKVAANAKHPEIIFPYADDDGKKPLARKSIGADTFVFSVPEGNYAKLLLFLASGSGPSNIEVDLKYKDNTIETRSMQVPDWFWELKPDDQYLCYVAENLSKWSDKKMLEKDHHYIFGLDLHPNPDKQLVKIRVRKSEPGIMAFLGATAEKK
jgi:hypothetical protein